MDDVLPENRKYLPALDRIMCGTGVEMALAADGLSYTTFGRAMRADPALNRLYWESRKQRGALRSDRAVDVHYTSTMEPARVRALSDALFRAAAIDDPEHCSEKIQVTHDAGANMLQALSLSAQIDEGRRRSALVRPMCDPALPAPAQVIDAEYETLLSSPDYESASGPSLAELLGDAAPAPSETRDPGG